MTRLLIILQTLVTRQAVLMPAVAGMLAACYRAFRPKSLDTPDFNTVSNWIFVALGLLAAMLGNLHDQNAKKIDNSAAQTSEKLTEQGKAINVINPAVQTRDAIAPPVETPVQIKPEKPVKHPHKGKP